MTLVRESDPEENATRPIGDDVDEWVERWWDRVRLALGVPGVTCPSSDGVIEVDTYGMEDGEGFAVAEAEYHAVG